MAKWMAVASLCALSLPACVLHLGSDDGGDTLIVGDGRTTGGGDPATETLCLLPASDGGRGGLGGLLSIRTVDEVDVQGLLITEGGHGGDPGMSESGPHAIPGEQGEPGVLEVLSGSSFVFDETQVDSEDVIQIGMPGSDDILAVGGTEAAGTIKVARLEIGPGATLAISRYPTIVAQQLIVHEGARLLLRDTGRSEIAIDHGTDPEPASEPSGLVGGTVTILAQSAQIHGLLDASGSDGAPGQDGGHGGHLLFRSENMRIATSGAILVSGGHGGHGVDEQLCPEAEEPL